MKTTILILFTLYSISVGQFQSYSFRFKVGIENLRPDKDVLPLTDCSSVYTENNHQYLRSFKKQLKEVVDQDFLQSLAEGMANRRVKPKSLVIIDDGCTFWSKRIKAEMTGDHFYEKWFGENGGYSLVILDLSNVNSPNKNQELLGNTVFQLPLEENDEYLFFKKQLFSPITQFPSVFIIKYREPEDSRNRILFFNKGYLKENKIEEQLMKY